jgi:hypothetical protein
MKQITAFTFSILFMMSGCISSAKNNDDATPKLEDVFYINNDTSGLSSSFVVTSNRTVEIQRIAGYKCYRPKVNLLKNTTDLTYLALIYQDTVPGIVDCSCVKNCTVRIGAKITGLSTGIYRIAIIERDIGGVCLGDTLNPWCKMGITENEITFDTTFVVQ